MAEGEDWINAVRRHAAEKPSDAAMLELAWTGAVERGWTWREVLDQIQARAAMIRALVAPGGTVVVALPSGVDLAAWIGGGVLEGARMALMHPRSGAAEIASVVRRAGAVAAVADAALLEQVDRQVLRLPSAGLSAPGSLAGDSSWRLDARATPPIEHLAREATGSVILSSSGTTGLPKLVVRDARALDADARQVTEGLGLRGNDRVLCVPPLCHSYGVDLLFGAWWSGAMLEIMSEYDWMGAASRLTDGVTVLPAVPFVFESLARSAGRAPRLRVAVSAGSVLSPRVREEFKKTWEVGVGQLYGASELGTVAVCSSESDPHSIGRGLGGVSLRVVDRDRPTRELPSGEEGELVVRAPSMLSSCVDGDVDRVDGHVRMGDLARRDLAGNVTITGRVKLLIDAGGFKVNPLEVEAALLDHPGVAECAVAAMELSDTIQRVLAFVVAKENGHPPSERELRSYLLERLAPAKVPRRIAFVESLPRSPLGKLQRDKLPRLWSDE